MKEQKRAAIYARVSTVGAGQDPGMQLKELREYCERRGWKVGGEYVHAGISGAVDSRPQLNRLMEDERVTGTDFGYPFLHGVAGVHQGPMKSNKVRRSGSWRVRRGCTQSKTKPDKTRQNTTFRGHWRVRASINGHSASIKRSRYPQNSSDALRG
jgi:hypothetical protein